MMFLNCIDDVVQCLCSVSHTFCWLCNALLQMDVLGEMDSHLVSHSPSKEKMVEHEHKSGSGSHGVDLHYLGQKFLGKYARAVYDIAVLLHL
jgi:hypothetical protein